MIEQQSFLDGPNPGEYPIPNGAEVVTCTSCGARIVWGTTQNGHAVPINVDQVRMVDGKGYGLTHFATCPESREWRRHRD